MRKQFKAEGSVCCFEIFIVESLMFTGGLCKDCVLLTDISSGTRLVQNVGVTGGVVSYEDHAQVGSPVACENPFLHVGPGLLSNLPC